jgi:hypothetical protein
MLRINADFKSYRIISIFWEIVVQGGFDTAAEQHRRLLNHQILR